MNKAIKEQILEQADMEYQKFSSALLPNINNVIGVRLPVLRKLAKKIAKENWREYMESEDMEYFEEVMLQGMVLGYVKAPVDEILQYIHNFIPKINNWSVCDSFCIGLKFTKENISQVWKFIKPYLFSKEEYEVRFGVVMIIDYYINQDYIDKILKLFDYIKHDGYYAKMAIAWAISICYVKFPEKTMKYLRNNNLDDFTYNKSLQKIAESLKVDKESKAIIRNMKHKS